VRVRVDLCNTSYDIKQDEETNRAYLHINEGKDVSWALRFASDEDLAEFVDAVSELEIANDAFNAEKGDSQDV